MAGQLTSTFRITSFSDLATVFPRQVVVLKARLHRGDSTSQPTIIKLKFEPEDGQTRDILGWLSNQTHFPRLSWWSRDEKYQMAGFGSAAEIYSPADSEKNTFDYLENKRLEAGSEHLHFFGGLSFFPDQPVDHEWRTFGRTRFIAPQFYFEIDAGHPRFIAQIVARAGIVPALEQLNSDFAMIQWHFLPPETAPARILGIHDFPTHTRWLKTHADALVKIRKQEFGKVVLSRKRVVKAAFNFRVLPIFIKLVHHNPGTARFYFEFEQGQAFLGASPERLINKTGQKLESEALEGTRPLGQSPAEAENFRNELLTDPKERLEQRVVRDQINQQFSTLCHSVSVDPEPRVIRFPQVQHLYQGISGELKNGTGIATILQALHPTPALGGSPRTVAQDIIKRMEVFARGWYGAPVGWIHGEDAEFAVAIRSALISDHRQINLYAGVGLVAGSDAEAEWREMNQKLRVLEESLDL